jgi:DNA-binding transcriptional LysR family regulator
MDLLQSMTAFVTTVNTGSMSAAASCLNMTPAMVGQHIAALETRLGTRLLNRTTRRQSLTGFGVTYLEQCKDILERVALADTEAEAQSSEARGLLRITAPVTFGSSLLMTSLKRYRDLSPLVQLDVVLTDQNVDIVEDGIDVAFRIGNIPDSRVIQRILAPYKMIVCASPEYLDKYGIPAHPTELSEHEMIGFTLASRSPLKWYLKEKTIGIEPKYRMTVNSGHALVNAAKSGLGIIIQPEILLKDDIKTGKLVQLLPDWQLGERQISLLYYRDKNMVPKVRSFINFAIKEFGEQGSCVNRA